MNGLDKFKKKETKTTAKHPLYPDAQQQLAQAVDEIVQLNEKAELLTSQLKDREELVKEVVCDWFYKHYSGKTDVPSSVKVQGIADAVLVQLTSRTYPVKLNEKNESKIARIQELAGEQVQESLKFEIDGNQIHEANREAFMHHLSILLDVFGHGEVDATQRKEFTDEINFLMEMKGFDNSNGSPSEACQLVQSIAPKSSLHMERHTLLKPDEVAELQRLMPYTTSIKKKGVK
jgi:hypothetical protein